MIYRRIEKRMKRMSERGGEGEGGGEEGSREWAYKWEIWWLGWLKRKEEREGDTVVYHSSLYAWGPSLSYLSLYSLLSPSSLLFSLDFSHSAHFLITVVPSYSFFLFSPFSLEIERWKLWIEERSNHEFNRKWLDKAIEIVIVDQWIILLLLFTILYYE